MWTIVLKGADVADQDAAADIAGIDTEIQALLDALDAAGYSANARTVALDENGQTVSVAYVPTPPGP